MNIQRFLVAVALFWLIMVTGICAYLLMRDKPQPQKWQPIPQQITGYKWSA